MGIESEIVSVRLGSGETCLVNRVTLAKKLQASKKTSQFLGERTGEPSVLLKQSPEALATRIAVMNIGSIGYKLSVINNPTSGVGFAPR